MKQQQDPIYNNQAAYTAALKALVTFTKFRFKSLPSDIIEDIAADALIKTYYYQNLTTSVLSFAKGVAFRRAIDFEAHESVKKRYQINIDQSVFLLNTEGVLEDDETELLEKIKYCVGKRSPENQKLFWADLDSETQGFTDAQKAEILNLKPLGVRKRRCDIKKAIIKSISNTPQYLTVSYRWRQRA
jgi:hypothetical protein